MPPCLLYPAYGLRYLAPPAAGGRLVAHPLAYLQATNPSPFMPV
jgi:hypothetical protein